MRATDRPSDMGTTHHGPAATSRAAPLASRSSDPRTAHWVRVRVRSVESLRTLAREGDEQVVVRACVHLGALLPADVKVDLLTPARVASRAGDAPDACCQLWSVQSYDNGTFVFEALVPAELVDRATTVGVRVRAQRVREEPSTLRPVIRWLQPPPATS